MSDNHHNVSRRLFDVLEYVGASEDMRNLHQTTAVYEDIARTMNSHLTNRPVSLLTFGSNCEGTTTPGLNSDIDVLCCRDGFHVKENIRDTAGYDISFLMVRDNHTQPGYVKLQLVGDGIPQTVNIMDKVDNIDSDCGGRMCIKHLFNEDDTIIERNGPADTSRGLDFGSAFRCATVPGCASEWIRRQRPYCWPSAQMIDQMKAEGCFVVGVGHPGSDEKEIEWRLSFSLQERQLMFSFNPVQHKCYILLKMIKHDLIEPVLGKSISSYHCKTCMFHVLEITRACIWRPENLYSCVRLCLIVLRRFVVNGNCPNYFIKEENMFDRDVHKRVKPRLIHILTQLISAGPLLLLSINCDQIGECMIGRANFDILFVNIMRHKINFKIQTLVKHCQSRIIINMLLKENDLISSCCWLSTFVRDLASCVYLTTNYDELQTREAIRHIIPIFHSRLAQQQVSLACSTHDILVKHQMLHASMYHFNAGSSCDLTSSRLAHASVLYKFGEYDICRDLLDRIVSDLQPNVVTMCCCSTTRFIKNLLDIPPEDMPSSLSTTSSCVTFLPSEVTIVPVPLQYEMSRSVDTPPGSRDEKKDYWYDFAVVDGRVYPHVLKYLINSKLNRTMHKRLDISNLRYVLENERNLAHRETGYNLLGWIYIQENRIPEGVQCFMKSWSIRPHHNAAKWHIWSLVNTLLSRVSGV